VFNVVFKVKIHFGSIVEKCTCIFKLPAVAKVIFGPLDKFGNSRLIPNISLFHKVEKIVFVEP
jgi:hypothetical protein